jgi:phospholipase/lecithinase/hemolysin
MISSWFSLWPALVSIAAAAPAQLLKQSTDAKAMAEAAAPVNNLVLFGNSYTAVGYDYSGPRPSTSNPIGNPTFPGNNLSQGNNWVTYLTTQYNSSTTLAYDFAWNCATVDASLVAPCDNTVVPVAQQVESFQNNYWQANPGQWTGQNTLTAIWIGINDAHRSYSRGDAPDLMNKVIDRYFELVTTLIGMGMKNILLLGIPGKSNVVLPGWQSLTFDASTAIERTPQVLNEPQDTQKLEKAIYDDFNVALWRKFNDYRTRFAGTSKLFLIDTVPIFNQILDSPSALNAPDAVCVGKDQGCLWSDDFHPSPKFHNAIAQRIKTAMWEAPQFFG